MERMMSIGNPRSLENLGSDPAAAIPKSLLTKIDRGDASLGIPVSLNDLTTERTYGQVYSSRVAAKLGFSIVAAEGSGEKMVYVHEYVKYKELHDDDERALYGIAIRWITEFSKLEADIQTLSLPFITASAEVGRVNAWSRFEVVGISSQKITENLPASNALKLNMEAYIRLHDAFENIIKLIWDDGNTICPQVLAIFGDIGDYTVDDYHQALAVGWALTQIRKGKSRGETLRDYNKGTTRFNELVESVYADLLGSEQVERKPSDEAKNKAKKILLDFEVKR